MNDTTTMMIGTTTNSNNHRTTLFWQQRRASSALSNSSSSSSSSTTAAAPAAATEHQTTAPQTAVHLLKGYIGTGCLSLPWALSQLGIAAGVVAIVTISAWTSYNCWTVVKLKRIVEQQHLNNNNNEDDEEEEDNDDDDDEDEEEVAVAAADNISENRSVGAASTAHTSVTYPAVGHWAYGQAFEQYVTYSVCIQQLAICTVYFSFVGENVLALLQYFQLHDRLASSHAGVVSASLPIILVLSFIPTLRQLSPVMMAGTITLFTGFAVILYLVILEWDLPVVEEATFHWNKAPLALCGILYSFEGICLILPVESVMKEPQQFQRVFTGSMILVAIIFASFASLCAYSFGNVTNGSITAFLLQAFAQDSSMVFLIMVANAFVSVSVILSYPLMLLPALELIASKISRAGKEWDIMVHGGGEGNGRNDGDDKDLSPFEPLPPLPEHDVASLGDDDFPQEHAYEIMSSNLADNDDAKSEDDISEDGTTTMSILTAMIVPEMNMPGDSPQLRTGLVFLTFVIAILIPNVQSLISLAGALAGTSTALLIPPLMELAWIRQLEGGGIDITSTGPVGASAGAAGLAVGGSIRNTATGRRQFVFDKIKCYILFTMGLILGLVGSYASIQDIIRSYSGSAK